MNKGDTTPIIVNGELRVNNKKDRFNNDNFKEPKKKPILDLFLTLICVCLIGYGVYTLVNKDDTDNKENDKSNSNITSNEVSNSNSNKKIDYEKLFILTKLESTNVYSKADISAMNSTNGLSVSNLSNNAKLSLASKLSNNDSSYITEEELDNSIKQLFGNIEYIKRAFICGKDLYTHNQETKMYYVMEESNTKIEYSKFDYVDITEEEESLIVKNYVVFTDGTKSWTLNNVMLNVLVNGDNIKDNLNILKHYEYKFNKINDNYYLSNISIR